MAPKPKAKRSMLGRIIDFVGLGIYIGAMYMGLVLTVFAACRLYLVGFYDIVGWTALAFNLLAALWPLRHTESEWWQELIGWTCEIGTPYFPIKVVVEDEDSIKPGRAYVVGYEPHSVMPVGIPMVFSSSSPLLPKAFQGGKFHGMASSVCFAAPFVRQLWWALGLRPVSRPLISKLLTQGTSVLLCPGGVQECLIMQQDGSEYVYLRRRYGFVRLAIEHGAPLVPVFAFGQSKTYSWWRPGPDKLVQWISRRVGAAPMAIWGRWGTPLPHNTPMTVVIGRAIEVAHTATPTADQVQEVLDQFIHALQVLFEKHKKACGYPDTAVLHVL